MKIILRKDAKVEGLKRYYTGKPCKHGHIDERTVSSGRCVECDRIIQKTPEYRAKRRAYEQQEHMRAKRSIYNKKPHRKKSLSEMQKRSYKNNKQAFLFRLLVSRIPKMIRNKMQGCSSVDKLGYTIDDFRKHIENKFQDGMNWDNHGEWHIDHIKPVASFNCKTIEDAKEINKLNNLQPLWAIDNLKKGDR